MNNSIMTRDNEIAEAASVSMTEVLMSTPNYVFSPRATDLLQCAYIKGAEWADSNPINPWHSVADGDFPKKSGDYLCSDGEDFVVARYSDASRCFLNPLVRYGGEYNDWIKYWMEIPQLPNIRKIIK